MYLRNEHKERKNTKPTIASFMWTNWARSNPDYLLPTIMTFMHHMATQTFTFRNLSCIQISTTMKVLGWFPLNTVLL